MSYFFPQTIGNCLPPEVESGLIIARTNSWCRCQGFTEKEERKNSTGFSQCYPNTSFNKQKVGILPIYYFKNLYSFQEWIKINHEGMWGSCYTFNYCPTGQLCIVCLGLPVQTAMLTSHQLEENFILCLLFLQRGYCPCGWQEEISVSGIYWTFCWRPDCDRIHDTCRVNSDAVLGCLLIWKSFFRSPPQLLTDMLVLPVEMCGVAYWEASFLLSFSCAATLH